MIGQTDPPGTETREKKGEATDWLNCFPKDKYVREEGREDKG